MILLHVLAMTCKVTVGEKEFYCGDNWSAHITWEIMMDELVINFKSYIQNSGEASVSRYISMIEAIENDTKASISIELCTAFADICGSLNRLEGGDFALDLLADCGINIKFGKIMNNKLIFEQIVSNFK